MSTDSLKTTVMGTTLVEKYSLAWLEMTSIVIFTVIGSLFYTLSNITRWMTGSRSQIETVCDSINSTSEQIYNAPLILINATRVSMVAAKENIHRNLSTALTVLERCIVWLIQMYKSTYRCLLGLAIHSVLTLVTQIAGPLQKAAQSITSFVTGGNFAVGDWTRSLTDTLNKMDDWFKNDDDLIQRLIDKPFQLLQTQINETLGSWEPRVFNTSLSPQQPVEQHCDPAKLVELHKNVENELKKCIHIFIGLSFSVLFICILANIYLIRFRHNRVVQERAKVLRLFRASSLKQQGELLLDKYTWSTSSIMPTFYRSWQSTRLGRFVVFMTHPIVLYCICVSILGLTVTYSLISMIDAKSQQLYHNFSIETEQWTLEATSQWIRSATKQYEDINLWINETELDLNNHAFGIIKSTAITINDTLTNVVDQVQDLIHTVLGGTLLESPAKDLMQCLFFNKITSIEQGLTWIAGNSYN
ncbi:unnamed protein product [Mucor hiemalis]